MLYQLWDTQIKQSDYSDAYSQLEGLANDVLNGNLTAEGAAMFFKEQYGDNAYAGNRRRIVRS